MLWEGWGERKRERAGHDGKDFSPSHRPPRAFYFFDYCYFYSATQREHLRRREPLESTAGEVLFKWSHRRISSADLKVRTIFIPFSTIYFRSGRVNQG